MAWVRSSVNSRARGHGDYWHCKNKQEKETDAAKQVLTIAGHKVVDLRARQPGQDSPDCEAFINGHWCGVDVSEFVDQASLEASIKGPAQHRAWTREDFCLEIQKRIGREDCSAKVKGGPYQKYFLVLVVDNLYCLNRENLAQFLAGSTFQASLVTDAYVGLSFHPEIEGKGSCPVFKLVLDPR